MLKKNCFLLIMVSIVLLLCFSSAYAYGDEGPNFQLTTNWETLAPGEQLKVTPSFKEVVNSNTAVLSFRYDRSKFSYKGFTPAEGVTVLNTTQLEDGIQFTIMVFDYQTSTYGDFFLSLTEGVDKGKVLEMIVEVAYALKLEDGSKEIRVESINATEPPVYQIITLLTLSDIIDVFGLTSDDPEWAAWEYFDHNKNGTIDIFDIANVAAMMGEAIIRN